MFIHLSDLQPVPTAQSGPASSEAQEVEDLQKELESLAVQSKTDAQEIHKLETAVRERAARVTALRVALAKAKGVAPPSSPPPPPLPPFQKLYDAEKAKIVNEGKAAAQFSQLGDLSGGAEKWFFGQLYKIDVDVKTARWTDLLVEVVRLTPEANSKQPEEILSDPVFSAVRAKYLEVYNPQDFPGLKAIGLAAIDAMRSNPPIAWDGESPGPDPPPLPAPDYRPDEASLLASARQAQFNAAIWARNFSEWAQYVRTSKKDGNFVKKAIRETTRVTNQLDKYVPGWSTLIDVVAPSIPVFAPLALAVKAISSLPLVGKVAGGVVQNVIPGAGVGGPSTIFGGTAVGGAAGSGVQTFTTNSGFFNLPTDTFVAKPIQDGAVQFAKLGSPVKFTVSKIALTAATTKGTLLQKLEAAGLEALAAVSMVVMLGCTVATGGLATPVCAAANVALAALKTGITLAKTYEAARQAKRAADQAKQRAAMEAAALEEEERRIRAEIEAIQAEKARIAALQRARLAQEQQAKTNQYLIAGVAFVAVLGVGYLVYEATSED